MVYAALAKTVLEGTAENLVIRCPEPTNVNAVIRSIFYDRQKFVFDHGYDECVKIVFAINDEFDRKKIDDQTISDEKKKENNKVYTENVIKWAEVNLPDYALVLLFRLLMGNRHFSGAANQYSTLSRLEKT